ncbi:cytochrome P450 [Biscogniauxia mediterranea]|nr:cytochrome P450 [Biscogniauxia mediterranea]
MTLEQPPYLTAVITEGPRLSPGVATRSARNAPDRELAYKERLIPRGTPVGMTTRLMHMNEDLYPQSQRALSLSAGWNPMHERRRRRHPFSRGTRNRLGMHLASAELYIVISALFPRFDFKFYGCRS